MSVSDYITLEELFYNIDKLTRKKAKEWLTSIGHPSDKMDVDALMDVYDLWKSGIVKVEGNIGIPRIWESS